MPKPTFSSVDAYIAAQPETTQPILSRVRNAIRKAIPEAEGLISYKMPTYKLRAEPVLYFAGWKHHVSLYPLSATMLAAFKDEIAPYKVHKSTIRFPLSEPTPLKLIARLAKFRADEVTQRAKADSAH